jgi:predicted dehydrogenase
MIRLGFLGVGWIGRNRMEALLTTGEAEAVALCDPSREMIDQAVALAPQAQILGSLDEMLTLGLDGIVIATPSALHAAQCVQVLNSGSAVFCQKPLGRSANEVAQVLDAARQADRPLGVDLSYRHTAAMKAIRDKVRTGALGDIFAADLVFHNAYGPGSGWFWDPQLSGGGCLIDLGTHLVDLALWLLHFPEVKSVSASLLRSGRQKLRDEVEDYAVASFSLANGAVVRIACSWNLAAGSDAIIRASFYGTEAGAEMANDNGSFFDFHADLLSGRERERLSSAPDAWGGRAAQAWLQSLIANEGFSGTTTGLLQSAQLLDRLYDSAV